MGDEGLIDLGVDVSGDGIDANVGIGDTDIDASLGGSGDEGDSSDHGDDGGAGDTGSSESAVGDGSVGGAGGARGAGDTGGVGSILVMPMTIIRLLLSW